MSNDMNVAIPTAPASQEAPEAAPVPTAGAMAALAALPPRVQVLERELELARKQVAGHTRLIRCDGRVVGEEIVPAAEGDYRDDLMAEIDRLSRHIEAMRMPVMMPDLVLDDAADASGARQYPWHNRRPVPAAPTGDPNESSGAESVLR